MINYRTSRDSQRRERQSCRVCKNHCFTWKPLTVNTLHLKSKFPPDLSWALYLLQVRPPAQEMPLATACEWETNANGTVLNVYIIQPERSKQYILLCLGWLDGCAILPFPLDMIFCTLLLGFRWLWLQNFPACFSLSLGTCSDREFFVTKADGIIAELEIPREFWKGLPHFIFNLVNS